MPHDATTVHITDYIDTESTLGAMFTDKHPMLHNSPVQETKRLLVCRKTSHELSQFVM